MSSPSSDPLLLRARQILSSPPPLSPSDFSFLSSLPPSLLFSLLPSYPQSHSKILSFLSFRADPKSTWLDPLKKVHDDLLFKGNRRLVKVGGGEEEGKEGEEGGGWVGGGGGEGGGGRGKGGGGRRGGGGGGGEVEGGSGRGRGGGRGVNKMLWAFGDRREVKEETVQAVEDFVCRLCDIIFGEKVLETVLKRDSKRRNRNLDALSKYLSALFPTETNIFASIKNTTRSLSSSLPPPPSSQSSSSCSPSSPSSSQFKKTEPLSERVITFLKFQEKRIDLMNPSEFCEFSEARSVTLLSEGRERFFHLTGVKKLVENYLKDVKPGRLGKTLELLNFILCKKVKIGVEEALFARGKSEVEEGRLVLDGPALNREEVERGFRYCEAVVLARVRSYLKKKKRGGGEEDKAFKFFEKDFKEKKAENTKVRIRIDQGGSMLVEGGDQEAREEWEKLGKLKKYWKRKVIAEEWFRRRKKENKKIFRLSNEKIKKEKEEKKTEEKENLKEEEKEKVSGEEGRKEVNIEREEKMDEVVWFPNDYAEFLWGRGEKEWKEGWKEYYDKKLAEGENINVGIIKKSGRAETLKFIDSVDADEDCQTIKAKHPEMKIVCQDNTIISDDGNNISPLSKKVEPNPIKQKNSDKKQENQLQIAPKSERNVAEYNIQDLFEENNSASKSELSQNNFSSWSSTIKPLNLSEIHDSFKSMEAENPPALDIDAVLNKIEQSNKILSETKYNNFLKKPEKDDPLTTNKPNSLSKSSQSKNDKAILTEKLLKDKRNDKIESDEENLNEKKEKIEKNDKNDKILQLETKIVNHLNNSEKPIEKLEEPRKPVILQPKFLELPSANHISGSEESDRKLKRIEEGQKELKKEIENLKNFLLSLNRNYENFSSGERKSEEEIENKINKNQNKLDQIDEKLNHLSEKVDQAIFSQKENGKNKVDGGRQGDSKRAVLKKEEMDEEKVDYRAKLISHVNFNSLNITSFKQPKRNKNLMSSLEIPSPSRSKLYLAKRLPVSPSFLLSSNPSLPSSIPPPSTSILPPSSPSPIPFTASFPPPLSSVSLYPSSIFNKPTYSLSSFLFGGPRTDKSGKLIKYSIIGSAEKFISQSENIRNMQKRSISPVRRNARQILTKKSIKSSFSSKWKIEEEEEGGGTRRGRGFEEEEVWKRAEEDSYLMSERRTGANEEGARKEGDWGRKKEEEEGEGGILEGGGATGGMGSTGGIEGVRGFSLKKGTIINSRFISNLDSFVRISRRQVEKEMEEARRRVEEVRRMDELRREGLNGDEKRWMRKEEILKKKGEERDRNWEKEAEKISNKINRSQSEHLMNKSSVSYRLKKELISSLDLLQTDGEKFGKQLWQLTLRKQPIDEKLTQIYSKKDLSRFQKSHLNLLQNPIEIVQTKCRTEHKSNFQENEWVREKFKRNNEKVKVIRPNEGELNGFMVEGKSKLKKELEYFEADKQNYNLIYLKPKNIIQEPENEEIIECSYNTRDLFLNTGSSIFPKITSSFSTMA